MQNKTENLATVLSFEGLKRVFQDFCSWGNSETVVNVAATNPTTVIASIYAFFCAPELFTFPLEHAIFPVRKLIMWVFH